MLNYTLRRLLLLLPMLLGVSIVIFLVMHFIPGDPAQLAAGPDATEADIAQIRKNYGLDQPLATQYIIYVKKIASGDFGESFQTFTPVLESIARTLPATIELTAAGMLLAVLIGVPLGIVAALKPRGLLDSSLTTVAVLGISIPGFFLGLILMLIFSANLGWLPPTGRGGLQHLILPAFTLGLPYVATFSRLARSTMMDVLKEDYIRTAYAKGVPGYKVILKHALSNAAIPLVTVFGMDFGRLLGGAVIVETVFAWPGMGRLLIDAIMARDIYVVQGTVIVFAAAVVIINLIVDLVYGILDPRITYN
ncbi:ABC transporter permease [Pseudomonas gingeri NCPPB 3146 = LMG 5327]|uniref:ABC transporter permease n=2 Tax=Pseudomonas gingeri TaxID=117681 RepID=A0A7Y7Y4C5_9PSED|nr:MULTISPECIES: ABC transporter permease [Pseudomonas]NWC17672.1 ABC transporter permease [Pseudomonas gingeri]NWE46754.1 ABC transporter permease [Pseudomonas gingeri]NWE70248.1 ABC transporter permease [Pseudomonas gingeri]PNQ93698.1 ABC transporter permease [Pseudomonas gingeri NCPPB 3146 = LMG 5327]BBP76354.1 peptide ABC transporter permease [Pseudomonas sp. Ost2]